MFFEKGGNVVFVGIIDYYFKEEVKTEVNEFTTPVSCVSLLNS